MPPPDPFQLGHWLEQHAAALELYAAQWTITAEDCVQDAFVQLAAQAETPPEPIAWLYRVARNRAINASRSARRRTNHERLAAMLVQGQRGTEQQSDSSDEKQESIALALETITDAERELIVLRIWSGLSWQQIADLTETSTSTAHRRYVAVLEKLKQILEPSCPRNLKSQQN